MAKKKPASKAKPAPKKQSLVKKLVAKVAPAKKPAAAAKGGRKSSWLDEKSNKPLIDREARRLTSFIKAMADGKVDAHEVEEQEQRLVALMKDVEPLLDATTHAKVTQLLCELTAYDLMQTLHAMELARPKTVFRG